MEQNEKAVGKNISKYLSYKYAYEQIKKAIEQGFFLEAITIEESIITDRIYPLYRKLCPNSQKKLERFNIGHLTSVMNEMTDEELSSFNIAFHKELDDFREKRNTCIHQIAKSEPGTATIDVSEFIKLSKDTAILGKGLTRRISDWAKMNKKRLSLEY